MGSERLTQIAADAVGSAQRRLPPELRALARGVAVHYEDKPGSDVIAEGFPSDILGLFTGSAHGTEFSADHASPPQILLYLENIRDFADDDEEIFREEVERTYLHELGHYLGWDEHEVAARGLD
ncbi:MAG: metallopeptidase family protein [Opitutaceae bacterium]